MSGGHFEYLQYQVDQLASDIDRAIARNERVKNDPEKAKDHFGWLPDVLPDDIIAKFEEARDTLSKGAKMANRIDWLLSGDDGEDSFRRRWKTEIEDVS